MLKVIVFQMDKKIFLHGLIEHQLKYCKHFAMIGLETHLNYLKIGGMAEPCELLESNQIH